MPGERPRANVGDPFRRHITTGWFNRTTDVVDRALVNPDAAADALRPQNRNMALVDVRNGTGGDLARYAVLGIDGIRIDHDDNATWFRGQRIFVNGVAPSKPDYAGRIVVTLEPIPNGEIGKACVEGVVQVKVDMAATGHRFAQIKDTYATELESVIRGPIPILPAESGTGVKWAIAWLGPERSNFAIGKVDSWSGTGPTSSGTVSVYDGAQASEADSTDNLTGVGGWLLAAGQSIATSTNVTLGRTASGVWYVAGAQCA